MYLLYTDETNMDPTGATFFIYGGCAVPSDQAPSLSAAIEMLRTQNGYNPGDPLKFNTRERPQHITPEVHLETKKQLIKVAATHGVQLLFSVIHHGIATSPEEARRKEINRICYHFDCLLHRTDQYGIVLVDTFQDEALPAILREKFAIGLTGLPFSPQYRLKRTLGFHVSTLGASHFSSVIDVVLGSVRFAINSREEADKQVVCSTLLSQLSPMLVRDTNGKVSELGLFYSPRTIKAPKYLAEYEALHDFLAGAGVEVTRSPSEPAMY